MHACGQSLRFGPKPSPRRPRPKQAQRPTWPSLRLRLGELLSPLMQRWRRSTAPLPAGTPALGPRRSPSRSCGEARSPRW
eukprot:15458774-Alexandrium_andersonii.AAC.1